MPLSGRETVKILIRNFGFEYMRQRGSHMVLVKKVGRRKIVTVVPNHKELRPGTMRSVLKLAEISKEEFNQYQ